MTVPVDTFQTYQAIGNREDLIDIITNIDPIDTWLTQNSGTMRAKARVHEWQTDVLDTAAANAVVEGDDATNIAVVPTVRLQNSTQILRKVFQISDTQESVDKAGRNSEMAYQMEKSLKALARDIEFALLINPAEVVGAAAVARQLNGVLGFITDNVDDASAAALTEDALNDLLGDIWADGGKPSTILVGSFQKRKISGFTSNVKEINAEIKKLVNSVDVYDSDYGKMMVRLHHQLNTTQPATLVAFGEMMLWQKAWLRPVKREVLARTGAATKTMIEAELTLESRQEKGSGKIINLAIA